LRDNCISALSKTSRTQQNTVDSHLARRADRARRAFRLIPSSSASPPIRSALRRIFDLACAVAGLVILSPLFLIVVVAIRLEGRGPVFFWQPRMGRNLQKFMIAKFRTMYPDASQACLLTAPADPRITRVGRFLRKHKIDELPQLINVIKGEMQLVGVRPQVETFVNQFYREYEYLLREPPGITDPAALAYRNEEQLFQTGPLEAQYVAEILPRKLDISIKYRSARTFLSDLDIILRTVSGTNRAAPPVKH
jgi:lipopolysaccharide/colanic/teichoic acid biosynthesis glycosyltransferase